MLILSFQAVNNRTTNGVAANKPKGKRCCARHCFMKIRQKTQEEAYQTFLKMENEMRGDVFLATCLQLMAPVHGNGLPPSSNGVLSQGRPSSPWPSFDDVSADIANESNGNQTVSDEIENAIKESLKDQENETVPEKDTNNTMNGIEGWYYFLIVNNRLRPVCLQFLLEVLHLTSERLQATKAKILKGMRYLNQCCEISLLSVS